MLRPGPDRLMCLQSFASATTRRVLTTEWIEGEKLSESNAADVRQLCTTLLNAYLIQLLDSGLLHADPHPGNLIRTPDGRICILDFGAPPRSPTPVCCCWTDGRSHARMHVYMHVFA